ncbi:HAAS signaling domain-containing protein [Micromonospora sp. NPDC050397]|uniref:HAAS signaling domain-containing protein n=1 Tax=Micromonospora sp. NPDC050397 TaxID=3364279 RepID=UPI00384D9018
MTARDDEGVTQRSEENMTQREIADYVERVGRALADLSPADRDELLEDLPEHLTDVAAEGAGTLVQRLGTPEAYAAELRAAAGLPAPDQPADRDKRVAAAVHRLRGRLKVVDGRVGPLIGYANASEFLGLLRPGWWVLRGYLVAMVVTVMTTGGSFGLMPQVDGSDVAGLLLLAVCVVGSIWLGRRAGQFRGWRRHLLTLGTVALVIFSLVGFVDADQRGRHPNFYEPAYNADPYADVRDVYVYDQQGRLLEGVLLFDQDGRPIRLGHPECDRGQGFRTFRDGITYPEGMPFPGEPKRDLLREPYPYCPERAPFRFTPATPTPSATPTPGTTPSAGTTPSGVPSAPSTVEPTRTAGPTG